MESAEPFVDWHGTVGIVALEIFVMEVVGVALGIEESLAHHHLVEACVARRRRQTGMQQVKQRVDWMRRLIAMPPDEVVWREARGDLPGLSMAEYFHRVRSLIASLEQVVSADVHAATLSSFLREGPDTSVHDLAWAIVERGVKIPRGLMDELLFLLDGEVPSERLPPNLTDYAVD
jgi:hypothetical protein